ncbi:MAG: hypothetical protein Fur0040_11450 [Sideroxydans sp.]
MSLLLDAMKKSSDQSQSPGLQDLSLEEATPRANSTAAPATENLAAARAAGQTLFAAKKKKTAPRFRWTLGIVPTTFIICSVIGAGYGYYVWRELNPPAPQVVLRQPPPVPMPVTPPAPPPLVATLQPQPTASATPAAAPVVERVPPPPRSTVTRAPAPQPRPPASKPRPAKKPAPANLLIERQPPTDTLTPLLMQAYQAYQRGDYATAAQGYQQVLQQDEHNRDALLGLGAIAQQQRQDQLAQHYYRQVLLRDPRDDVALAALASYQTDGNGESESQLKQMLAEQPRSAALHNALGNVYAEQSRWAEAQQAYFNARTLEPANAQFTYNLAVSLDHLGQGRLAAQHYRQAMQLDPAGNAGFDRTQAEQRAAELEAQQ